MDKGVVLSFLYLLSFQTCRCGMFEEPRCSKYDFEEKVLEKLVRLEHKMELMTESVNEQYTQVKDDIHKIKTDWVEIRKEFDLMKGELIDREEMLNDSIQKTMADLSGI